MRGSWFVFAVVAAWVSVGCGPYIDDVNVQHRSAVEAKLVEIQAIAKTLAATPALTKDKAPGVDIGIVLSDEYSVEGNAAPLYAEDFGNFDELGFVYARMYDADLVQRCSAPVHTERMPWDPNRAELTPDGASGFATAQAYRLLEGLKYVAVLRSLALAKPQAGLAAVPSKPAAPVDAGVKDGGDGGVKVTANAGAGSGAKMAKAADAGTDAKAGAADKKKVFSGGYLSAELLLFRVQGAKFIGGVRFEAESSAELKGSASDIALENDLRSNIEAALKDALSKKAPKVKVRK